MTVFRSFLVALLLGAALVTAGCGGGEEGGGVAAGGDAAAVAPADAALFLSVNTDFESEQWQAADALLARFPSGDKLITEVLGDLEAEGVDWETDVKPALGPEVALVGFSFSGSDPSFVGFTQPRDDEKFAALLARSGEPVVTDEIEGWTVFSDKKESIDRFKAAREAGRLADSDTFQAATDGLSGDGIALIYLDGARLFEEASAGDAEAAQGLEALTSAFGTFRSLALELVAEAEGVRLNGAAEVEGGPALASYAAELPAQIPADVVAFVSFSNLTDLLGGVLDAIGESAPDFDKQLGLVELGLGLSIRDDLLPLFAREGALVVAPGAPIPTVSLILEVDDDQQAAALVDKLVAGVGGFLGGGKQPVATTIEGVPAKELALEGFSLFYAGFDGKLVVTTSREGIAGLRAAGPKLADDPDFQAAREAAGMPDETTGFAYVNLGDAIRLAEGFAQTGGQAISPEVSENLAPLESLLLYGTQADGTYGFSGFLEIR